MRWVRDEHGAVMYFDYESPVLQVVNIRTS
jgi:hypothetical protein